MDGSNESQKGRIAAPAIGFASGEGGRACHLRTCLLGNSVSRLEAPV